jgi:hypothetical protein
VRGAVPIPASARFVPVVLGPGDPARDLASQAFSRYLAGRGLSRRAWPGLRGLTWPGTGLTGGLAGQRERQGGSG